LHYDIFYPRILAKNIDFVSYLNFVALRSNMKITTYKSKNKPKENDETI